MPQPDRLGARNDRKGNLIGLGGIQSRPRGSRPASSLLRRRPSEAARRLKLDSPGRAQGPIRDGTDHGTQRGNQASALLPLALAAGSRQGGQSH